jgi:ApbE superfamily uncharacterized protein (UPF0280 family)
MNYHFIKDRFYRQWCRTNLVSFAVVVKETDLFIQAKHNLTKKAREAIFKYRAQLEKYISLHPLFQKSLSPLPYDPFAPKIVRQMLKAAQNTGVGPMAAVAGAIAQAVGEELSQFSDEVIVENGGDIYLSIKRPVNIAIFAGDSPLSGRIGLKIPPSNAISVCTSSAKIGHSLSQGQADAVTVIASDAALADAAATAIGNLVKKKEDLPAAIAFAQRIEGVQGVVIILGKYLTVWGEIELIKL